MVFTELTEPDLDSLREISNIGAGHAVTALYQMTNRVITLEGPKVGISPFSKVVDSLGGPEEEVLGLFFRVYGGTRCNLLVIIPKQSVDKLLTILFNSSAAMRPLNEMAISALKEVGNILTSSYLSAISGTIGMPLIPSIPAFSMDMAQAVLDLLLIELSEVTHQAMVIETNFRTRDQSFSGHFFLLPDPGSIDAILKAIKARMGRG